MSADFQIQLRDQILSFVLPRLTDQECTVIEAAAALAGALAVVIACLPTEEHRDAAITALKLDDFLRLRAGKHAETLRNGEFDRQLERGRQ